MTEMYSTEELINRIANYKAQRRAVILAHNYQVPEVQDIADFVGDSLELSRKAAETNAKTIVFCGVNFMAETAKILSPDKTVILPEREAGCPMADMITPEELRQQKAEHPGVPVVCYVNSSAAVKAESDICCTSANAVKVAQSLPGNEIIFIPDKYLGAWVAGQTNQKGAPLARLLPHPRPHPPGGYRGECVKSTRGQRWSSTPNAALK